MIFRLGTARARVFIGLPQRLAGALVEVQHETRFIDLHPLCTIGRELLQDIGIDRENAIEQRKRIETLALAETQICDGAEQHGPCQRSHCLRLEEFVKRLDR